MVRIEPYMWTTAPLACMSSSMITRCRLVSISVGYHAQLVPLWPVTAFDEIARQDEHQEPLTRLVMPRICCCIGQILIVDWSTRTERDLRAIWPSYHEFHDLKNRWVTRGRHPWVLPAESWVLPGKKLRGCFRARAGSTKRNCPLKPPPSDIGLSSTYAAIKKAAADEAGF